MATIEVENLSKEFPQPKNEIKTLKVLDNISFQIKDGEFVAFFGPNGCGKTTLLNILSGIDEQTSGKILVNQKETKKKRLGLCSKIITKACYLGGQLREILSWP